MEKVNDLSFKVRYLVSKLNEKHDTSSFEFRILNAFLAGTKINQDDVLFAIGSVLDVYPEFSIIE